MILNVIINQ